MKRIFLNCLLLGLLGVIQAQTIYTPDNLPKVHLQDKTKYVCNPEGILSVEACSEIDRILYALEQKTGIETVVAAVPSIGEKSCFDFAHELLNQWGVGKKEKNNGLVIVLVTDQRCIQFYTGYGLEGDLPDAICKRIQTRYMIPHLKDNRWSEGMIAGIQAVYNRLESSMENDTPIPEDDHTLTGVGLFLGFIVVGGMIFFLALRTASRCPHCGKHELQRSNSRIIAQRRGVKTEEVTYICRNCGHVVVRRQQSYDEHYRGGGGSGPFIGGFGGGFGGGGSFGGGSFGGGMGGGGGAGSRF